MGLAFLVVPFLPATNMFFTVGFVVAERVLYLSSIGSCLITVLGLGFLSKKSYGKKVKKTTNFLTKILLAISMLIQPLRS